MIITKVLNARIDLIEPSEIYAVDLDKVILKHLNTRYVGRCYMSMLIISVDKIIKVNDDDLVLKCKDYLNDGSMSVDVKFVVSGVVYARGEIIHGCRIAEINGKNITAQSQYATILLKKNPGGDTPNVLQTGMIIPVIADKIGYTPAKKVISIVGYPFIPLISKNVYFEVGKLLEDEEVKKLKIAYNEIVKEEEIHKELVKSKSYKLFNIILYPYKKDVDFLQNKIAKDLNFQPMDIDLNKLIEIKKGIIITPNEDNKLNRRCFYSGKSDRELLDLHPTVICIKQDLYTIISRIFTGYILHMRTLRGFIETYNTPESFKPMEAYFNMCKVMQQNNEAKLNL